MLWSEAVWRGPPDANYDGPTIECRGLVLHIAEGSFEGTINWMKNPISDVSSHFVHGLAGERAQMLDTATTAWTQGTGNGHWVSVENEGFHTDQFTPQQIESNAQLFAWLAQTHGVPLQLTDSPSGIGLGWHGMGGVPWGNHPLCPGPANVELRSTILARAIQIVNGTPTEEPMQVLVRFGDAPPEAGGPNQVWLTDGMFRRLVPPSMAWGDSVTDGLIGNNGVHNAPILGNLGNGGLVAVSIWSARDAWGQDIDLGAGGGGGPTATEIREIVDEELDEQSLGGADPD